MKKAKENFGDQVMPDAVAFNCFSGLFLFSENFIPNCFQSSGNASFFATKNTKNTKKQHLACSCFESELILSVRQRFRLQRKGEGFRG